MDERGWTNPHERESGQTLPGHARAHKTVPHTCNTTRPYLRPQSVKRLLRGAGEHVRRCGVQVCGHQAAARVRAHLLACILRRRAQVRAGTRGAAQDAARKHCTNVLSTASALPGLYAGVMRHIAQDASGGSGVFYCATMSRVLERLIQSIPRTRACRHAAAEISPQHARACPHGALPGWWSGLLWGHVRC